MKLQFRHVENALVRLFAVDDSCLGAFKARMRHLRNLGVPNIAKPGSGERVEYTREGVVGLALALELERLGRPPREAAWLAMAWASDPEVILAATSRAPLYLIILPGWLEPPSTKNASEATSEINKDAGIGGVVMKPFTVSEKTTENTFLANGLDEVLPLFMDKECPSLGIVNISALLQKLEKDLPKQSE
jgi:hypothetical protein